ncbi:glycoside hydrolase family 5 protein [Marinifilum sp.]|uniref:glycoside hydrolase family 5 protein n=1 Tax=Marinifilum sp. TaxID=2033137 RepID=UPI003BAC1D4D
MKKKKQNRIVSDHGALRVLGNQIVNEENNAVCLAGMSYFWSNHSTPNWEGYGDHFYNEGTVSELAENWNCDIVRCAIGVDSKDGMQGGLCDEWEENFINLRSVIDQAIIDDIYVIVDFHTHYAHEFPETAEDFFGQVIDEYPNCKNLIFEIYNEPKEIDWESKVKPYAEQIINYIRNEKNCDNLILVGTTTYCQDVDIAADSPLGNEEERNIAYGLHFYAATHQQVQMDKAMYAIDKGNIALFATEWGTVNNLGQCSPDEFWTDKWMTFLRENMISHCNWSLTDKVEGCQSANEIKNEDAPGASALVQGASVEGDWDYDADLTPSGMIVKPIVENWQTSLKELKEKIIANKM